MLKTLTCQNVFTVCGVCRIWDWWRALQFVLSQLPKLQTWFSSGPWFYGKFSL